MSKVRNIIHKDVFNSVSQGTNVLDFLNKPSMEEQEQLEQLMEAVEEVNLEELNVDQHNVLALMKLQLHLSQKKNNPRRYPSDFLIKCAMLYRAGPEITEY